MLETRLEKVFGLDRERLYIEQELGLGGLISERLEKEPTSIGGYREAPDQPLDDAALIRSSIGNADLNAARLTRTSTLCSSCRAIPIRMMFENQMHQYSIHDDYELFKEAANYCELCALIYARCGTDLSQADISHFSIIIYLSPMLPYDGIVARDTSRMTVQVQADSGTRAGRRESKGAIDR